MFVTVDCTQPSQFAQFLHVPLSAMFDRHGSCQSTQLLTELFQRLPYAAQTDRLLPNEVCGIKTAAAEDTELLFSNMRV